MATVKRRSTTLNGGVLGYQLDVARNALSIVRGHLINSQSHNKLHNVDACLPLPPSKCSLTQVGMIVLHYKSNQVA